MRQRVSLVAIALAAWGFGATVSVHAASLEDEVAGLVKSDPTIGAQQGRVQAATQGIDVAKSGYYPQLHVTANEGPEHFDTATQRLSGGGKPLTAAGNGAGALLTQRVWDGGLTPATVSAARDTEQVEEANLRITRQNRLMEAATIYLNLMQWRDYLAEAQKFNTAMTDLQKQVDDRVKGGGGDQTDSLNASNQQKYAESKVVSAQGAYNNAIVTYIQVFGHPPELATLKMPLPPDAIVPTSLDDAITAAGKDNPTVDAAKRSITLSGDLKDQASAGYYPTIDLVGKVDYGQNRDGNTGIARDWETLVQLNWDLFSGFRTKAANAQAANEMTRSQALAEAATRKSAQDVRMAYVDANTAKRTLEIAQDRLGSMQKMYNAKVQQQKTSKNGSINDVMGADYAYFIQSLDVITFKYAVPAATYRMLYAMGRLEPGNLDRVASAAGPSAVAK